MTNEERETIEWLGLRFESPTDWQIVRHALSPEDGRLALVDRRSERLEISWRRCTREPDIERMLQDQRQKELETMPSAQVAELPAPAGWRYLARTSAEPAVLLRAVRFDASSGRLIEAVAPAKDDAERRTALDVLATVEIRAVRADGPTEWRAFDLRVGAPPYFRLVKTRVVPADVSFDFRALYPNTRRAATETASVRRRGMARTWYPGDPRALFSAAMPSARSPIFRTTSYGNHEAWLAEAQEPVPRWQALFRRPSFRRVLAWHCEQENAIYTISTASGDDRAIAPDDFHVRCGHGADHA